jgi:hypothetical protein
MNFNVSVWEERDRLHIMLESEDGCEIASWWDDDARQMFEDGFFDRRRLKESVIEYAIAQKMLPLYRVLSIDAWRELGGGWTWNEWREIGTCPATIAELKPRPLLKWMRDNGYLKASSVGKAAVEDDGYNVVIVRRGNRQPEIAIEPIQV